MVKVFKKRAYDIILFIMTMLGVLYLSTIFIKEYFDTNNLNRFFKLPSFFNSPKLDIKNNISINNQEKDEIFNVWTLKISEYSKDDFTKAKNDYKQLLSTGYRVYLKLVDSKYILYLGPEIDKKNLEKYSKELFQKYKLNAKIEDYNVNISVNDTVVVI